VSLPRDKTVRHGRRLELTRLRIPGSRCRADPQTGRTYADALEAKLPPDAPKGQMLNFSYTASTIYPGTERDVSVYVPSQYKGDRPACLYVKLDGRTWASWNEPAVFEKLIAKHEMPVPIMVALTHGTVWKDKEKGKGLRYDRTYEWDSTNDNLARFIESGWAKVRKTTDYTDGTDGFSVI
jgi:hypothetical protein